MKLIHAVKNILLIQRVDGLMILLKCA